MKRQTRARIASRRTGLLACMATTLAVAAACAAPALAQTPATPEKRAEALLARMTLDEKIALVHGDGFAISAGHAGHVPANKRLGIPELFLADGPNGVGNGSTGVTAFPAAVAAASTWDVALVERYGVVLGEEQAGKGHNIALSPTLNILRVPHWGRGFETFSEDPYLSGQIAVAAIKGVQSQGVVATAKHYLSNNQETDRPRIDAKVTERALREIYMPGFLATVKEGKVGAIMCAYNKLNGAYACENDHTLNGVLKQEWGFQGFVMSDWFATHSTVAAARNGLDMEMPAGDTGFVPEYFGAPLEKAVESGAVSTKTLDDKVRRILTALYRAGLFDRPALGGPKSVVTNAEHQKLARELAERGTVLLKNAGDVLPLDAARVRSLAIIGDAAGESAKITGGGSANVIPSRVSTPIAGITAQAGQAVKVRYARGTTGTHAVDIPAEALTPPSGRGHGLQAAYYPARDFSGTPVVTRVETEIGGWGTAALAPVQGLSERNWSVRWTGTVARPHAGLYRFAVDASGVTRVSIDGKPVVRLITDFGGIADGTIELPAGPPVPIEIEYVSPAAFTPLLTFGWQVPDPAMLAEAVAAAKQSEVVLVFVNDVTSEGSDRTSLALPGDQNLLISTIAQANPRTVVVLNTGGPVLMPWLCQVAGVVEVWYPGQEYGDAIAAVLFGDANPAGKLPMTFPADDTQGPAKTKAQFPGDGVSVSYDEGLLVGYRWYDAKGETPLFPFGHGLSYTSFGYANLAVTPVAAAGATVSVRIANTGPRPGTEVVQLYVGFPPAAGEPPQQLKAFKTVSLKPGEAADVTFALDLSAFAIWDEVGGGWTTPPGSYRVLVGASSRDIRGEGRFEIRR